MTPLVSDNRPTIADLPTIDECHEFMAAINTGRKAIGLDEIDRLEYDHCTPNQGRECLSAHHLFVLDRTGPRVGERVVCGLSVAEAQALSSAFNTTWDTTGFDTLEVPPAILRITRIFDASYAGDDLHIALRDRLSEAGLIEEKL